MVQQRHWFVSDSRLHLVTADTKGVDDPEQQVPFQYTAQEDRGKSNKKQSPLPTTARRDLHRVSQPGPCFQKFGKLDPCRSNPNVDSLTSVSQHVGRA